MAPEFNVFLPSEKDVAICRELIQAVFPDAEISEDFKDQATDEKPERLWQQEITNLEKIVTSVKAAINDRNPKTNTGFRRLFADLPKPPTRKHFPRNYNLDLFITDILRIFRESVEKNKMYSGKPGQRNHSGKLKIYPRCADLTLREMRLIIHSYSLTGKTKTPAELAQEEGIKSIYQSTRLGITHLCWILAS